MLCHTRSNIVVILSPCHRCCHEKMVPPRATVSNDHSIWILQVSQHLARESMRNRAQMDSLHQAPGLGEALHRGPDDFERDTALEPHARRTRMNEAGDAVAASQGSITRGLRNLQLMDGPFALSPAAPARHAAGDDAPPSSRTATKSVLAVCPV